MQARIEKSNEIYQWRMSRGFTLSQASRIAGVSTMIFDAAEKGATDPTRILTAVHDYELNHCKKSDDCVDEQPGLF